MMNRRFSLLCCTVLAATATATVTATAAAAEELAPGLWEITLETRVPGAEGFSPGANQIQQCLTLADARDPSRLMGSLSSQGASGCGFTSKSYSGNTFRFTMECAGSFELKTRGEVSFSASSMSGTITATGSLNGKVTEFQNKLAARRLGNC
ncbi:MAG: DUF3617 family protein [Proteobacteria bacterium]|nr:DUF3617 family protein [Pseudomonadota bacterium]